MDLATGDAFGFLGFDFRRARTRSGKWRAHYAPRLEKRTALLRRLKELFRRYQSQPVGRVIELINPILRGWVTYFAIRPLDPLFRLCAGLGGEESEASLDAGTEAQRVRLEEVE